MMQHLNMINLVSEGQNDIEGHLNGQTRRGKFAAINLVGVIEGYGRQGTSVFFRSMQRHP